MTDTMMTLVSGTWALMCEVASKASVPCRSMSIRTTSGLRDRKSTRLNSSHGYISYAVFCLKKKKKPQQERLAQGRSNPTTRQHGFSYNGERARVVHPDQDREKGDTRRRTYHSKVYYAHEIR